jgi:hypothetical protein
MGLDITIREYKGVDEKGYLIMQTPAEDLPYTTDRVVIRHELSKNIEFGVLKCDDYYNWEEYYRPKNFDEAYKWCNTLKDGEYEYVKNLLDSLAMNENYWLEYGY